MKKFLALIALSVVIPIEVFAVQITNVKIEGKDDGKYGDFVDVTFNVDFSGLDAQSASGKGIYTVVLDFELSNGVRLSNKIESDWDTVFGKVKDTNSLYRIVSIVGEETPNLCADGFLFCGNNYKVTISLSVAMRDILYADIVLKEVAVGAIPVDFEEFDKDDVETVSYIPSNLSHRIKFEDVHILTQEEIDSINKQLKEAEEKLKELEAKDIKVEVSEEAIKPSKNKTPTTSIKPPNSVKEDATKTQVKSLEIEGYDFKFYENKDNYALFIEDDVNSVDLKVELKDSSSTYEIIGADDLKKNDYKIKVVVTSSGGNKKTYEIDAVFKKDAKKEETTTVFGYTINKKTLTYGVVGLIVVIVLIILKIVFSIIHKRIDNRKINRELKKINKA